jgi:hypothetical protein
MLSAGSAHAAKLSKRVYTTAISAAKGEAARRFDASPTFTSIMGQVGRKLVSAHKIGSSKSTVTFAVTSFSGPGGAIPGLAVVKVVKRANGFRAVQSNRWRWSDQ